MYKRVLSIPVIAISSVSQGAVVYDEVDYGNNHSINTPTSLDNQSISMTDSGTDVVLTINDSLNFTGSAFSAINAETGDFLGNIVVNENGALIAEESLISLISSNSSIILENMGNIDGDIFTMGSDVVIIDNNSNMNSNINISNFDNFEFTNDGNYSGNIQVNETFSDANVNMSFDGRDGLNQIDTNIYLENINNGTVNIEQNNIGENSNIKIKRLSNVETTNILINNSTSYNDVEGNIESEFVNYNVSNSEIYGNLNIRGDEVEANISGSTFYDSVVVDTSFSYDERDSLVFNVDDSTFNSTVALFGRTNIIADISNSDFEEDLVFDSQTTSSVNLDNVSVGDEFLVFSENPLNLNSNISNSEFGSLSYYHRNNLIQPAEGSYETNNDIEVSPEEFDETLINLEGNTINNDFTIDSEFDTTVNLSGRENDNLTINGETFIRTEERLDFDADENVNFNDNVYMFVDTGDVNMSGSNVDGDLNFVNIIPRRGFSIEEETSPSDYNNYGTNRLYFSSDFNISGDINVLPNGDDVSFRIFDSYNNNTDVNIGGFPQTYIENDILFGIGSGSVDSSDFSLEPNISKYFRGNYLRSQIRDLNVISEEISLFTEDFIARDVNLISSLGTDVNIRRTDIDKLSFFDFVNIEDEGIRTGGREDNIVEANSSNGSISSSNISELNIYSEQQELSFDKDEINGNPVNIGDINVYGGDSTFYTLGLPVFEEFEDIKKQNEENFNLNISGNILAYPKVVNGTDFSSVIERPIGDLEDENENFKPQNEDFFVDNNNANIVIDNSQNLNFTSNEIQVVMARITNSRDSVLNVNSTEVLASSDIIFEDGSLLAIKVSDDNHGALRLLNDSIINFEDGSSIEVEVVGVLSNNKEFTIVDAEAGQLMFDENNSPINIFGDDYDVSKINVVHENDKISLVTPKTGEVTTPIIFDENVYKSYDRFNLINNTNRGIKNRIGKLDSGIDSQNLYNRNSDRNFYLLPNYQEGNGDGKEYTVSGFLLGAEYTRNDGLSISPFYSFNTYNYEDKDISYQSDIETHTIGAYSQYKISDTLFLNNHTSYTRGSVEGGNNRLSSDLKMVKVDGNDDNFYTDMELKSFKRLNSSRLVYTYGGLNYSYTASSDYEIGNPIEGFNKIKGDNNKNLGVYSGFGLEQDTFVNNVPVKAYVDTYYQYDINSKQDKPHNINGSLGFKTVKADKINFDINVSAGRNNGITDYGIGAKVFKRF